MTIETELAALQREIDALHGDLQAARDLRFYGGRRAQTRHTLLLRINGLECQAYALRERLPPEHPLWVPAVWAA
jgi:hypothetical protein